MAGSITLPQVVLDLEEEDRKAFEALTPPATMVVRYGYMKLVAELPYDGKEKVGCGSKLVIRTDRGTEMAEMLTTTCGNSGCGKSVSRQQMLDYINASGGKNYPFTTSGRIVRIATVEDLLHQQKLDGQKRDMMRWAKEALVEVNLPMKLVDVELLLGGERVIFHYTSEDWVDFRDLVKRLAAEYQTRIDMHQVSARDEARIVADYEKCGQHCCCKQFLKVLKPVSMRMAKVQKATMDPTKISGRCGRLMCCLRYEDETYDSLKKNLPFKQTRVITEDGPGTVVDTQILTQLALVVLDSTGKAAAYPVESLTTIKKGEPNYLPPEPREPYGASSSRREGGDRGSRGSGMGGSSGSSGGSSAGSSGSGGSGGSGSAGAGRGERGQPSRPKPGRPVRDDEVESADGDAPEAFVPNQPPAPPAPTGSRGYGNRIVKVTKPPASAQDQDTPDAREVRNAGDARNAQDAPDSAEPGDESEFDGSGDGAGDGGGEDASGVEGDATGGSDTTSGTDGDQANRQGGRRRKRRGRGRRRRGGGGGGGGGSGGGGGGGGRA